MPSPATSGSGSLPNPDGLCLSGPRGRLAVALQPRSLAALHRTEDPTHWLIPVDEPDLVRASRLLPGTILWLGSQPPNRLLGALVDHPLGAWLHRDSVEIQLDDGPPIRRAFPRTPNSQGVTIELARLVAQEWMNSRLGAPVPTPGPLIRLPRIPDYAAA